MRREHCLELTNCLTDLGLVRSIVKECPAKEPAAVLQDRYREVAVLVAAFSRTAEGRLKREAVNQVEFAPHDDASSCFSSFLHDEIASVKAEVIRVLTEKQRVDSLFQPVCLLIGAAIHEKIFSSRVSVIVAVEQDVTRVLSFTHHDFCCEVLRALLH